MPTPTTPLSALQKATSIGPSTPDEAALTAQQAQPGWKQAAQTAINGSVDALKGLVGFGDGSTPANAIGQVLGAASPLIGASGALDGRAALRELLDIIHTAPAPDPAQVFMNEKVGGYVIPRRSVISPPEGFEFPPEMGTPYTGRDPALVDKYVAQQNSAGAMKQKPPSTSPLKQMGNVGSDDPELIKTIQMMRDQGMAPEDIARLNPTIRMKNLMKIFAGS